MGNEEAFGITAFLYFIYLFYFTSVYPLTNTLAAAFRVEAAAYYIEDIHTYI